MADLSQVLGRLAGRRIVVLGDLCLDEYLVGRAARLSREAPVPVLEFERSFRLPGAAANPALNVRSLGGEVAMVGVVGDDEAGHHLRRSLEERGIEVAGVVTDPSRATTVKTRVMAEVNLRFPQQMVRLDRQDRAPLAEDVASALAEKVREAASGAEAILVSDYKGGVVSPSLIATCLECSRSGGLFVSADSQGDLHKFRGFDVVKANQQEVERVVGSELVDEGGFQRAGEALLRDLGARGVVITRGPDGMTVVEEGGRCTHLAAANRSEVYDVTGAGDTVIAMLTLALAAGAGLVEAATLANVAAGLVVRKLGNATTTLSELRAALGS